MAEEEKKPEFKIDDVQFNDEFFNADNLETFKNRIIEAKGVDKGSFETFSEKALTEINFYLEESKPNDLSREHLKSRIMSLCLDYENATKKRSKKVAKVMHKIRETLTNPEGNNQEDKKSIENNEENKNET